jgi:methyl-accepting chemotaxis protein
VAAAVEQQDATIRDIAGRVDEAAGGAARVAERVRTASGRCDQVSALALQTTLAVQETGARIADLRATMVVSLRSSAIGDRRQENRVPVHIAARMEAGEAPTPVTVLDLSLGGALVRLPQAMRAPAEFCPVTLEVPGIGRVVGEVLASSRLGTHVRFAAVPEAVAAQLRARVEGVAGEDAPFIAAATAAAADIAAAFEQALERHEVSEPVLFDTDYVAVPGSDPEQFTTGYVGFTDRVLPALQEPLLALNRRTVFAAAVDRNGYLPTHNKKFSHPPRPDDPAWNAANCRNRRIFNDRAGLAAARSTRAYLLQTYARDMGNGTLVTMKEVDAPIRVRGRHWGALRLAYHAA